MGLEIGVRMQVVGDIPADRRVSAVIHYFDLCADRIHGGHDGGGDKAQALTSVNRRWITLYQFEG